MAELVMRQGQKYPVRGRLWPPRPWMASSRRRIESSKRPARYRDAPSVFNAAGFSFPRNPNPATAVSASRTGASGSGTECGPSTQHHATDLDVRGSLIIP